jgi:hypothetical protein
MKTPNTTEIGSDGLAVRPMEFNTQAVLHYTDASGARRVKIFADGTEEAAMARLDAAVAKYKIDNPLHDMAEVVEVVPVAALVPMSRAERRSELAQQAYFRRFAPCCGRSLGYDC